jgi:hypothetical protein
MRVCIEKTGGQMVLGDSFGQSVFKESLRRMFRRVPDDAPVDAGQLQVLELTVVIDATVFMMLQKNKVLLLTAAV